MKLTDVLIGFLIAAAAYMILRRPSVAMRELREPSTTEKITDLVSAGTELIRAVSGQSARNDAGGADAADFGDELGGMV
jgi:uncharacterized spore protein YtfJ